MPNSRGIRAGRAFVELFAEDSELNRALMRAAGRLKAFGRAVRNIGLSIGSAGAGILAPLIKGVETYARMSFELNRANQVTGISGKALSGLSYAAEKSGVDFMTLTLAIGRYQRNLVNAVNGDKMARQAFEETGVSIDALAKMSPEAQFYAMADAFAKMGDPATRAHAALVLFGRGATRLLPMLEGGSGAIRKLVGEAKEIGRVWSNSDIRMGAYLYQTWIELKGAATAPTEGVPSRPLSAAEDAANVAMEET